MISLTMISNFRGKRWLKIFLRCAHLLGGAGVFSSVIVGQAPDGYWLLLIVSGAALLLLDAFSNLLWFIQLRALFTYIKFILLALFFYFPDYGWWWLSAIIVLSGISSHAPGNVRYYSLWHKKVVQSPNDIKG